MLRFVAVSVLAAVVLANTTPRTAAAQSVEIDVQALTCSGSGAVYYEIDCVDLLRDLAPFGTAGESLQATRLQRNDAGDQSFVLDLGSRYSVESVEVYLAYSGWCGSSASYAEDYEIVVTDDASLSSGAGGVVTSDCSQASGGFRFAATGGDVGRYVVVSHPAVTWSMVSGFRVIGSEYVPPTPTPTVPTPTPIPTPGVDVGPCSWEFGGVVEAEPEPCPEALPSGVTRDDVQLIGQLVAVIVIVGTAGLVRTFGPGSGHFS